MTKCDNIRLYLIYLPDIYIYFLQQIININVIREMHIFPIYKCSSLKEAVQRARPIAKKGEIVLFSPASASFDMFKNFAERGEIFKEYVKNLE